MEPCTHQLTNVGGDHKVVRCVVRGKRLRAQLIAEGKDSVHVAHGIARVHHCCVQRHLTNERTRRVHGLRGGWRRAI